jgi:hypothetical protein
VAFSIQAREHGRHAADPPKLESAVPNWSAGDTISFGVKTLRVVDVRYDDGLEVSVLVVEDLAG